MLLITGGRLGDLYGRKRMFMTGMACFTLASTTCGFAPNGLVLICGRILQGASAAVMAPQVLATIRILFSRFISRLSQTLSPSSSIGASPQKSRPAAAGPKRRAHCGLEISLEFSGVAGEFRCHSLHCSQISKDL